MVEWNRGSIFTKDASHTTCTVAKEGIEINQGAGEFLPGSVKQCKWNFRTS